MATTSTWTQLWCTTRIPLRAISSQVSFKALTRWAESERFDKDFAVADQRQRQEKFDREQDKLAHLRQERYDREVQRYQQMNTADQFQQTKLQTKVDHFNAGKKNQGGAAYNLIRLDYEPNTRGQQLKATDDDANVRAQIRARELQRKGNGSFNILTGQDSSSIQVPHHERYNPILGNAAQ